MSAPHHLPQRHLNLLPNPEPLGSEFSVRPNIADLFSQLLYEIEMFLLSCTYEEMCKFWQAIANLRNRVQNSANYSEVPQFLTDRRKQRDFSRILEVLADLPYPKLHLSNHLVPNSGDRRSSQQTTSRRSTTGYPRLAIQR